MMNPGEKAGHQNTRIKKDRPELADLSDYYPKKLDDAAPDKRPIGPADLFFFINELLKFLVRQRAAQSQYFSTDSLHAKIREIIPRLA